MGKHKKTRKMVDPNASNVGEDRFRAAETRPQFRPTMKHSSKVVLDDRFASVLTDPRFQLHEKDRYGRKKTKHDAKQELSAFYTVENKDEDEKQTSPEKSSSHGASLSSSSSNEGADSSSDLETQQSDSKADEDPASRIAYLTAFSRGEIEMSSSSDEDDSSDSSDDEDEESWEDPVLGSSGILDPNNNEESVETTDESSPYIVVMNMDWEHIRAVDLYSIISSFTPPGAVHRVQVFQSDYGAERMAKEKIQGPTNLWKKKKQQHSTNEASKESGSDEEENSIGMGSDGDDSEMENSEQQLSNFRQDRVPAKSDFDPEKLRAYEASKLKYYFAVVEFKTPEFADIAYREVDGLEFEHSSAAMDMRALPSDKLSGVVMDRSMRDEATSVPSNYIPPDFIVSALQQTNVQCTWDLGNRDRERTLTKYYRGDWRDAVEADDLKVYLASDASSDDGHSDEEEQKSKGSRMRKLLGLDSDDESKGQADSSTDRTSGEDESVNEGEQRSEDEENAKEIRFIPGRKNLEDKIRAMVNAKQGEAEELTPWQKYQEKRKQKRKERKQAAREKTNEILSGSFNESASHDDFFLDGDDKVTSDSRASKTKSDDDAKKELELLFSGDEAEEQMRDYDIRGIQRMEKNKDKKLRGSRKRKEDKLAATVSGTDFKVNMRDNRFSAVLEGSDDRFGIDKTDPSYKETPGMRKILAEQTKRRQKKRRKGTPDKAIPADVNAESGGKNAGSNALSALVQRLKTRVSNK